MAIVGNERETFENKVYNNCQSSSGTSEQDESEGRTIILPYDQCPLMELHRVQSEKSNERDIWKSRKHM